MPSLLPPCPHCRAATVATEAAHRGTRHRFPGAYDPACKHANEGATRRIRAGTVVRLGATWVWHGGAGGVPRWVQKGKRAACRCAGEERGAQSRKQKQKRGAREVHPYTSGENADRTKIKTHKRRVTPPLIGRQTPRPPPPPCPPLPPPTPWPAPAPSRPCRRPCRRPPPPPRPPTPWH